MSADHDLLIEMNGKLDSILERMAGDDEIQPIPKRCVKHITLLRTQWFHIRSLWGVYGVLMLIVVGAVIKHIWF